MFNGNTASCIDYDEDLSPKSDSELLLIIAEKNTFSAKALSEFTKRHYNWVYRVCLMRLGNHADALDVAQEVLIRVQKYAHRFENRSALRTWLYRIAQNQCNTFAAKFNDTMFKHIEDFTEILSDPHTENTQAAGELTDQIRHVLSKLSDQCKTMIELRFFYELSLEEISKQLNIGLSAAKMRLYRALAQFKSAYISEIQYISLVNSST